MSRGSESPSASAPSKLKSSWAQWLALAVIGSMVCGLAVAFPRSGDDWAWGSSMGIDRLHTHFAGYNGRYLANLVVLTLTRATWLIPIVVGLILCLIIWMIADLAGQRDLVGLIATAAIMLAMPLAVWKQSIVWVSGFTNYAFGSAVLLAFLCSVRNDVLGKRLKLPSAFALLGFSIAGQLFIEHVTIFILLGALALVGTQLLHPSLRVSARAVAWAAGSIIGAAIMFSNSAYRNAAAGTSQYQKIGSGGGDVSQPVLVSALREGLGGLSQFAFAINTVLNAVLVVLILGLALVGHRRTGQIVWAVVAVSLAGIGLVSGVAVLAAVQEMHLFGSLTPWSWVSSASMFASLLLTANWLVADRRRRFTVIGLAVSVVVLIAPLAVAKPYGPRNFLPSYVLLTAVAVVLLAEVRVAMRSEKFDVGMVGVAVVIISVMMSGYVVTYAKIHAAADQRLNTIREAVERGQKGVSVWTLPAPLYVHTPDPTPGDWEERYKLYYGIPADFRIRLVDSSRY